MSVDSVHPDGGPTSGGTIVTVAGTNFLDGFTTCKFGTVSGAAATYIASTRLLCLAPAHGEGTISVEVSNNAVDFTAFAVEFGYYGMW